MEEEMLKEFEKIPRVRHAPDFEEEDDDMACLSVPVMREFLKKMIKNYANNY